MAEEKIVVINAEGLVAGRLASVIAKRLLRGEKIVVVNVEKAIITGKRERVLEKFRKRIVEWRTHYNPEKRGPKYPRVPDRVFKRMVRGMLPYKKPKGRKAYRRLRVYVGIPQQFKEAEMEVIKEARLKNKMIPVVTLGEVYELLSGRVIER